LGQVGTAPDLGDARRSGQDRRNGASTAPVRDLHCGAAMKRFGWIGWTVLVTAAATSGVACGGAVDGDGGQTAGGAGAGALSGTGGTGASSSGGTSGAGGSAAEGGGGYGGAAPVCCTTSADCPEYFGEEWQGSQCIAGVCKPNPAPGLCWTDSDCGGAYGSCFGGSVCPCLADCDMEDQLGKCSAPPGCCTTSADCDQKPFVEPQCVAGNCESKPPPGQCWTDADCGGSTCQNACICPCGMICACGGQMGWCEGGPPPPPPPGCCTSDWQCGDYVYSPCVSGVCKQPVAGHCWKDAECAPGQTCVGAFVCPCGAACGQAETPGKCQ
jgi:hypothetical protein